MEQRVQLLGWIAARDHVEVITLPVPPAPHPFMVTALHVPALGAYLSAVRPPLDTPYPDEFGTLRRDERGAPQTLTLLGMDWVVLAQVAHGPACEVADAGQSALEFDREVTAALDALEDYQHD